MSGNQGGRNQEGGRKPRNYYVDYTKKNKYGNDIRNQRADQYGQRNSTNKSRFSSTPNISIQDRGFLITSVDEVKSYLEMRNILEEYHNQIYQEKEKTQSSTGHDSSNSQSQKDSIEDELESELKQLRSNRPFKQVKTQCRRTLFINIVKDFKDIDPIVIVDKLFQDLAEKRQIRTSNTFKVLPILDTFRNSLPCVKTAISNILENIITDKEDRKYFIEFQTRGNFKLSSEDKQLWIEAVAEKITEMRPRWKVDRESCYYMIVLVALKELCCVTFLKDYFRRSKYNISEYCKDFVPNPELIECPVTNTQEDKQNDDGVVDSGDT